jgi:quinol monooxygenase YgiN
MYQMITEIALFTAAPGKAEELGAAILKGLEIIRQQSGCISARVERCIEQPDQYLLTNTWTSLEAHMVDFRSGPLFPQWREQISGLFINSPSVFHYQAVEKE